jgi:hypothetical protein
MREWSCFHVLARRGRLGNESVLESVLESISLLADFARVDVVLTTASPRLAS